MEDTQKILKQIQQEYNRIVETQNTSNAIDFIWEIITELHNSYYIVNEQEKKEKLYNEISRRYKNLDSLAKRLQDNYNSGTKFEQNEQDRLDLCAILDTFDGNYLDNLD